MPDNKELDILNKLGDLISNRDKDIKKSVDEKQEKGDNDPDKIKIIPLPPAHKP